MSLVQIYSMEKKNRNVQHEYQVSPSTPEYHIDSMIGDSMVIKMLLQLIQCAQTPHGVLFYQSFSEC